MPENESEKLKPHPFRHAGTREHTVRALAADAYAELAVTSNYTFLTGASHPEELMQVAAMLGYRAVALADTNTLAGIVRAHVAAKEAGIAFAVGCRLVLSEPDGFTLLVYPTTKRGYSNLCRMLTIGKRRAPKGECHLTRTDLCEHQGDLLAVAMPPLRPTEIWLQTLQAFHRVLDDDRLSIALCRRYCGSDAANWSRIVECSRTTGIPLAAINDVLYHDPERRALQDVVTCIRHGCTIDEAGYRLQANAERHLKPADEMARIFAEHPKAVTRSVAVATRAAAFSLDELRYEYPVEPCPEGVTPYTYLAQLTHEGAAKRYPAGVPQKVLDKLAHELALIEELRFEAYFLTCYDIVRFARSKGILCQGRGGAANSSVCYCLGITEVDPNRFSTLFERFVSRARGEPPDIDIDFEHERREEVIQYLYQKYGRDRAALTAEVITYRGRSAVRDIGKVMGLTEDALDAIAKQLSHWDGAPEPQHLRQAGLNPDDRTIMQVIALANQIVGFPRHLSQHVGGFVITRTPLCELVPVENAAMEDRTVIEWDKDDIDAMGMLKVDVLGLGMLTCIRKAFELIEKDGGPPLSIASIPQDDPGVYEMMCRADTIGVFQIESRAQMSMLPRLRPKEFFDLVIEVAIVRPGPIQGKMVHPYIRRRMKEEPVTYPSPEVREVLERTLGVPLFQEQAMQLAIVAAGFTPDEADQLRRAIAAWKRKGDAIVRFGQKIIGGMVERGYPLEFAERCFEQMRGFSSYGFPESHAASFAILVYVSAWLKYRHPAAFAASLINSQPMGFYAPAQIVRDAAEHGVKPLQVDVNGSEWNCGLERTSEGLALRLGMRLVKGVPEREANLIAASRRAGGRFGSLPELWRRSRVSVKSLRHLAKADAFGSLGLDRQGALWQIQPLRDEPMPLFEQVGETAEEVPDALPERTPRGRVLDDYASIGLSLKAHPVSFIRADLDKRKVIRCAELRDERMTATGTFASVAGLVLVRQRPSTASGVVFITLEDETGIANLIIWSDTYERYRRAARLSRILLAYGKVERQREVVHLHVRRLVSLDGKMEELEAGSRDFH
jgi:error-prone DNA polymerase